MNHRIVRVALWGLLCAIPVAVTTAAAGSAAAAPEPPAPVPTAAPTADALVPVPAGCPQPDPASVAFVGTMLGKDDITQTVRFRIEQLRAGSANPWAIDGLIDVRYGPDYRFLEVGHEYLVGAGVDATYGVLSSTVRPAEPLFGGNDVIGVDDVAVTCPTIDDPVRTLEVDGTSVDSGLMTLMTDDRRLLMATIAVPAAIVFAALVALVVLKVFGVLAMHGVFRLGRAAVTPVPDHRAVRVRRHRDADPSAPLVVPIADTEPHRAPADGAAADGAVATGPGPSDR